MQKPIEYYLSLPAEMVNFDDPDTPESIKIRARLELQNRMHEQQVQEQEQKKAKMKGIAKTTFTIAEKLFPFPK